MDPLEDSSCNANTTVDPPASAASAATDTSNAEAHIMPGMSKYDFVKIRVHLGSHYYVLSRFLVSRMLQVGIRSPLSSPLRVFFLIVRTTPFHSQCRS
jgi:hypothetical protein